MAVDLDLLASKFSGELLNPSPWKESEVKLAMALATNTQLNLQLAHAEKQIRMLRATLQEFLAHANAIQPDEYLLKVQRGLINQARLLVRDNPLP